MGNQPNQRVIVNDRWVRADNHCPISMKLSPKWMLMYACVCVEVLRGQEVNRKLLRAFVSAWPLSLCLLLTMHWMSVNTEIVSMMIKTHQKRNCFIYSGFAFHVWILECIWNTFKHFFKAKQIGYVFPNWSTSNPTLLSSICLFI